jgi:hypothetical protein
MVYEKKISHVSMLNGSRFASFRFEAKKFLKQTGAPYLEHHTTAAGVAS